MTKKAPRKDVMSLRIEPKLKYLIDLAARIQRRNLTNYVEWALEESLKKVTVTVGEEESNLLDSSGAIWSTNEAERFIALAINFNDLLTFEEQRLWELIQRFPYIFLKPYKTKFTKRNIRQSRIDKHWTNLVKAATGELDEEDKKYIALLEAANIKSESCLEKLPLDIHSLFNETAEIKQELSDDQSPENMERMRQLVAPLFKKNPHIHMDLLLSIMTGRDQESFEEFLEEMEAYVRQKKSKE